MRSGLFLGILLEIAEKVRSNSKDDNILSLYNPVIGLAWSPKSCDFEGKLCLQHSLTPHFSDPSSFVPEISAKLLLAYSDARMLFWDIEEEREPSFESDGTPDCEKQVKRARHCCQFFMALQDLAR